jgi:hypothetical protein
MKKLSMVLLTALLASVLLIPAAAQAAPDDDACWGQAASVFAQMGAMGQHASEQPTPRLGLRNLARALYDAGAIPDDTVQALSAYVATELGLSIDECLH